jgi:nicotinamide riboside transporter PnuC
MLDILSFIAMALSLLGNILLVKKVIWVFPIWIVANVTWIVVNFISTPNISQIIMFVVYTILAMISWYQWKK